ncbi:23S rRNA (adenine(2503)-C(2))-methyltransferase RlmN [Pseudobacteriovorax antillogorgiicola]|uniref:23S rRNA m(2)A-2503 methyltransferase n=1 Tax=Pseudobacteriovorax antillogorgiicola TaxID=1513793 RepID=A0A1Y6BQI0_9BACT|nr:23S rRNA (adenine(2503)-C(2))-methyltransferase RlmN [Pseudobacteriovorax antillogorgiicola]TCS55312.1 23S rRNA m(2)A-2503 methyltransferase [Pseudobacteriovorax antillogorgiicola]SMF14365.1 23S rRNA m(2)A-2503 methyltransferase [Pseudobacteriovorax antillogorgiicola]
MQDFFDFSRQQLQGLCSERFSVPILHADTLFREAYKAFLSHPWQASQLPKKLQETMSVEFSTEAVRADQERLSRYDHSVKFLAKLGDGELVETVLMPERGRVTVCISSQVGCAQACTFCYTGRMGLKRNLSAGEIVGQVMMANSWIRQHPGWLSKLGYPEGTLITNVVFMGMGEPLDNVENVSRSLDILNDPLGLNLSLRRISVSTAGHLDGIKEILRLQPKVTLALSLHASTERERSQLMPINRKWPITEVLAFLKKQYAGTKKSILIQYTVIHGVNDSLEHAARLVELLRGLPIKLNLIPLNDVEPTRFTAPDPARLEAFRDFVHQNQVRVMIRYSKGQDIGAACGQLVVQ